MTRIWSQKPPEAEVGRQAGMERKGGKGRREGSSVGSVDETAILPPASYLVFGRRRAAAAEAGREEAAQWRQGSGGGRDRLHCRTNQQRRSGGISGVRPPADKRPLSTDGPALVIRNHL